MTDGKTLIDTVDSDTFTSDPGAGIECGKVDAPAEVWVETPADGPRNAYLHCGSWPGDRTKYTRADLSQAAVEALEAKLAKAIDLGCELANCGEYGMQGWDAATKEWDAFTAELTGGKDD